MYLIVENELCSSRNMTTDRILIWDLLQPWYPTDGAGIAPWPTTLAS